MATDPKKRVDLGAWLADLRRVGGQARSLAEKHEALESLMALADLQMLEEATKRIIVAMSKETVYGFPASRQWESKSLNGVPRPAAGIETGLLPPQAAIEAEVLTSRTTDSPLAGSGLVPHRPHGIIGTTQEMCRVHHLIEKAASCSLPVLIQGESGTGKELVARAIHERSGRQERRFFSENCSALSESLLESELFGHVRGAFTGADRDRKGILELADGGTLFLDEIGDTSVRMQSKLLRALQEHEFRPVGGKETIRVDVRIISATNRSLGGLIREGAFREDFFYRVNVITIDLPPLRARKDDIPALVNHFLDRIAIETGLMRKEFSPGALELLAGHEWPGNIRELENIVQRAVALSDSARINAGDLPDRIRHLMITEEPPRYSGAGKGGEHLMIEKALHNFEGDKTRAARFIGWSRPKLYRRMRYYGIPIHFGRGATRSA
jgi:transcriptional regulator with PAS, ATPase and Fis domain